MSTFGGLMVEYPHIAIDRFQGPAVLRARAYFLSHTHADHMVGLDSTQFSQRLGLSKHIRLYCSEVTRELLLTDRRFSHLAPFITSLPIEEPKTIRLYNETNGTEDQVLVTLMAAGHCPGSVMFLFEGEEGNVLYTGDFRLAKGEAARMLPLHSGSRVKDIKSVYADTTFCVPEALFLPSREMSRDALLDLVEKHIEQSPTHMVRLACKAKYGYEFLFVELSKEFNLKVHVSPLVMAQYKRVPDLAKHLTTDGRSTQVHACRYVDCRLPNASNVLVVTPSTMWFTHNAQPYEVIRKERRRYRLCFSFHSSFSEVRDFIGYIRPVNIYANVIPYHSTEEMINERLRDLRRFPDAPIKVNPMSSYKPLGQLKRSTRSTLRNIRAPCQNEENEELNELFSSSPPSVKRQLRKRPHHEMCLPGTSASQDESGDHPEDSTQQSYLAMDDSDLSSSELDLYDLPQDIDEPQPLEGRLNVATEQKQSDGFASYSKMSPFKHIPHRRRKLSENQTDVVDNKKETGDVGSEKQLLQESRLAEIDNWLKYLPNAKTVNTDLAEETTDKETTASVELSELNSEMNPNSEIEAEMSDVQNDCDIIRLNSSQCESEATAEYSIKASQEMLPLLNENSKAGLNPPKSESNRFSETLSHRSTDGSVIRTEHICSDSTAQTGNNNLPHRDSLLFSLTDDLPDNTSCPKQQDILSSTLNEPARSAVIELQGNKPLKSSRPSCGKLIDTDSYHQGAKVCQSDPQGSVTDTEEVQGCIHNNIVRSESRATVILSSQASPAGSLVPRDGNDNKEHSEQDTSQSQDTFLPSSQGSVASRCSSDFDIPCTPEGKGLQPEQVEAVRARIARGDAVSLKSCKKTLIP